MSKIKYRVRPHDPCAADRVEIHSETAHFVTIYVGVKGSTIREKKISDWSEYYDTELEALTRCYEILLGSIERQRTKLARNERQLSLVYEATKKLKEMEK